jgi:glycosyltransferase involved in cell wall biosynthesis
MRMKIAYLSPVGFMGGAEQVLLNLMIALRSAAPALELHLIAGTDGDLLERAARSGVIVHQLILPPVISRFGRDGGRRGALKLLSAAGTALRMAPAVRGYARRLAALIRQIDPALVHSNGLKMHLLAALADVRPIPLVWHLHEMIVPRRPVARALRWGSKRAAGAIAISHAVATGALEAFGGLKVITVHNGIDIDHFRPGPSSLDLDALAGVRPAPAPVVRVGLVATYARWKGQDVLLEAASILARERPDLALRFYIVGGPIYRTQGSQFTRAELTSAAQRMGLLGRVAFIDFQSDPREVYRSLDIVVHASTAPEPFGLAIVEAMACARSVIVSKAGGAQELFSEGADALGAAPGDAPALARAIASLADDAPLRRRLGANAARRAAAHFSRDRFAARVLEAYANWLPSLGSDAAGPRADSVIGAVDAQPVRV